VSGSRQLIKYLKRKLIKLSKILETLFDFCE
jgi:hypothetical protein